MRARSATRPNRRSAATRERILGAVDGLLAEGRFHEATMEEVAARSGVSRATLYLHVRSRLDLVDAICRRFAAGAPLRAIKVAVEHADPVAAMSGVIEHSMAFWAEGDSILAQLYDVAAVDPAAEELVQRQRRDRRNVVDTVATRMHAGGCLRDGVSADDARAALMVLTSYATWRELRAEGLADGAIVARLQQAARRQVLAG